MPSRVATGPRTYDLLGFGPQYGDELVIFGDRKLRHPPRGCLLYHPEMRYLCRLISRSLQEVQTVQSNVSGTLADNSAPRRHFWQGDQSKALWFLCPLPILGFTSSPTFLSQQFGLVVGKPFHCVERLWRLWIQIGGSMLLLGLFGVGCAGAPQSPARSLQIHAARRWQLGNRASDAVAHRSIRPARCAS